MTEPSKAEQELMAIIQEAWCDGDNNPEDKFGDFLKRAAKAIVEAGYINPKGRTFATLDEVAKAYGYILPGKFAHIIPLPETKETPSEIERYRE